MFGGEGYTVKLDRFFLDMSDPGRHESRNTAFAKSDVTEILKKFLVEVRADGTLSVVKNEFEATRVESFISMVFSETCEETKVSGSSPRPPALPRKHSSGKAYYALVEFAARAARVHAQELYTNFDVVPNSNWM